MRLFLPSLFFLATFPLLAEEFSFLPVSPAQQKGMIRYSGSLQSKTPTSARVETGLHQESLFVVAPITRSETDALSFTSRGHWLDLSPNSKPQKDLYMAEFGLAYTHQTEDKHLWNLSSSLGSASDEPFKDGSVNTVNVTGSYVWPAVDSSQWAVIVNYSNNRPFLSGWPVPGFVYLYSPSKSFRGIFGAPFNSIYWQFSERWSLNLRMMIPRMLKASVSYRLFGPVQAYTGCDFSQMTFLAHGRANPKDRLFFDERKFFMGVRSPVNSFLFAELEGGRTLRQRFFSAENYTNSPNSPLDLEPSTYFKLSLSASWD